MMLDEQEELMETLDNEAIQAIFVQSWTNVLQPVADPVTQRDVLSNIVTRWLCCSDQLAEGI